jgi:transcriptional regulator GlxA family with amidase domain
MKIALLLFDGMTALDAIGPLQVLSALPGAEVFPVASAPGPKRTDAGVAFLAATTWTTSVCTGALVLGAAGLLRGLRATTHWAALGALRDFGAEPVEERMVRDGKVITGAGVSAGIDMALRLAALLAGESVAQTIQLMIEYDPAPPFRAGSPATAPAEAMDRAMRLFARAAGAAA